MDQVSSTVPRLASVAKLAELFADSGLTEQAIRNQIFKATDRKNSRGEIIPGNGLAKHGAIVRVGTRVLVDVDRYANWLTSGRVEGVEK